MTHRDEVLDDIHVRQRIDRNALSFVNLAEASKRILTANVHCARAADAYLCD